MLKTQDQVQYSCDHIEPTRCCTACPTSAKCHMVVTAYPEPARKLACQRQLVWSTNRTLTLSPRPNSRVPCGYSLSVASISVSLGLSFPDRHFGEPLVWSVQESSIRPLASCSQTTMVVLHGCSLCRNLGQASGLPLPD